MPNMDNVYTGANGALTLAPDNSPEGKDAKTAWGAYSKTPDVGRVTGVAICVTTDLKEYYQIGQRHPVVGFRRLLDQEAQAKLPDLIHKLSPGDELVITEDNQPVAKLVIEIPKPKAGLRPPPGRPNCRQR